MCMLFLPFSKHRFPLDGNGAVNRKKTCTLKPVCRAENCILFWMEIGDETINGGSMREVDTGYYSTPPERPIHPPSLQCLPHLLFHSVV